MIEVSKEQAQNYILDSQGLRTRRPCKSVLEVAKRVHNIQIDTISVVSRSHNLTTFNRYSKYIEDKIWDEMKANHLFEFWSHSMCLMPIETYPYYKWVADIYSQRTKGWPVAWGAKNGKIVEEVYSYVQENGPTASRDLGTSKKKRSGWWDWKVEKRALEYLFTTGRLMVAYRDGFQKHYDLTERVLPPSVPSEPLSTAEAAEFAALTCIRSLGLASWLDIKFYTGSIIYQECWKSTKKLQVFLDSLVSSGELEIVKVTDAQETYYVSASESKRLQGFKPSLKLEPMKFLCPFDNLLRERHRPKKLWSFDYKIEAYTPANERQFGYYVLPILHGNQFVGRMDAKVHRQKRLLEVKSLFLESVQWKDDETLNAFKLGLDRFSEFHGCEEILISRVAPKNMGKQIQGLYH